MKLSITIKPIIVTGKNMDTIKDKYSLFGFTISSYGEYYKECDTYIYVINFEKRRFKTKQVQKVVKGKNITSSTIIQHSHWIGNIYVIPKSWLSITNKKVIQNNRTFKIVDKRVRK